MRIFLLIISVLFLPFIVQSQEATIDELKLELERTQDTSRIRILNALANQLARPNLDSALLYAREAKKLADQLDDDPGRIRSMLTLELIFAIHQIHDSLIVYADQARALALKTGDQKSLQAALLSLGASYDLKYERQKAIDHFKQSLKIAIEIKDHFAQAKALSQIARTNKYIAQHDTAEYYYLRAVDVLKKSGNKNGEANAVLNLATNAAMSNQLEKAISYYEQGISILRELGNKRFEGIALGQIAYTYQAMAYYPSALDYSQQALALWESMEHKDEMARTLTRIGAIYELAGNPEKALPHLQRALNLWEGQNDIIGQAGSLNQIGNNYSLREKYDTALVYFFEALALNAPNKDESLRHIGNTYEKTNQLDSAVIYLQQALAEARRADDRHRQAPCLISLGAVYKRQGKIAQAKSSLEEALVIIQTTGARDQHLEARKLLYELHKDQNNFQLALGHYEAYKTLEDSLFNAQNTEKIVRLEAKGEFEKEKQQLEFEQERKNAKQSAIQRAILVALGIAVLLILIIGWYYRSKQRTNIQLQRLNEEISQQKDQLEELDEIKSRFFTNISHELRTPLTVIGGMAQQIQSAPQKWLDKGIPLIIRNNTNLLNLVNQILDLRKLESGNLKLEMIQGDIVLYLQEIVDSFQSMASSKGLKLHFLPEEPSMMMDYDKEKLLRVVSNLLSNAIKFTPEGGDIYLRLNNTLGVLKTPRVLFNLKIQDTGIGIPPDKVPHVFDRFYQVDDSTTRKGEGTGIGLALSRELVRLMGGDITLQSEAGTGSTFTVQLPVTQLAEQESGTAVPAIAITEVPEDNTIALSQAGSKELPSLLIIEDNPDLVQYLSSFLEGHYRLLVASDGAEGIDMAIREVPDLIISDVMMPKKDGFEVCATLKKDQLTSHVPIVMLTAKADVESRIAGLERGADAYLAKPFNQRELMVRLQNLYELRKQLQERYQSLDPILPSDDINIRQEDTFVLKLRELIDDRMEDEQFGVPELCQAIGISRSQLLRKTTALMGSPPSHIIKHTRLKKARELLLTTELNVSQVAYEVGFRDPSYFGRIFYETFQVKPSAIRK